jgi:hypothetical protein
MSADFFCENHPKTLLIHDFAAGKISYRLESILSWI